MPRTDFHSIAKIKSNPSQTIPGAMLNFNNKIIINQVRAAIKRASHSAKSGVGCHNMPRPKSDAHAQNQFHKTHTRTHPQKNTRGQPQVLYGQNHGVGHTQSKKNTAIAGQGTSASLSAHVTTLGHWREPLGPRGLGTHVERLAVFTHVPPRRGQRIPVKAPVVEEIGSLTTDRRAYQTTAHSVGHSAQKKEIKMSLQVGKS